MFSHQPIRRVAFLQYDCLGRGFQLFRLARVEHASAMDDQAWRICVAAGTQALHSAANAGLGSALTEITQLVSPEHSPMRVT